MAGEKELILELFKDGKELSTSEVVNQIYAGEFIDNNEKNKLHRKLIYHLNKLVEERILLVCGYLIKGEKIFKAARNIVVDLPHSKIVVSQNKHQIKDIEIDKELVIDFKPFGVMVNSIVINAEKLDIIKLNNLLRQLYKEVNDVIAIYNVEEIIYKSTVEQLKQFLNGIKPIINQRKLSLVINFDNPKSQYLTKLYELLINNEFIEIVIILEENHFLAKSKQIEQTIDTLRKSGQKINISKKGSYISYSGNAGAYTFIPSNNLIDVVSTNSVCFDLAKIKLMHANKIRELLIKIARELHQINSYQQFENEELFPIIKSYGGKITNSANTIRFWNYNWKEDEYLLELIDEIKDELNEFTLHQERIYVSAGMPINFNISLSTAFNSFSRNELSVREYEKRIVNNFNDLLINYKDYLALRNKYFLLFEKGDRLRVFRSNTESRELLKELHHLLILNIPYFTYDFRNLKKEISLRDFM